MCSASTLGICIKCFRIFYAKLSNQKRNQKKIQMHTLPYRFVLAHKIGNEKCVFFFPTRVPASKRKISRWNATQIFCVCFTCVHLYLKWSTCKQMPLSRAFDRLQLENMHQIMSNWWWNTWNTNRRVELNIKTSTLIPSISIREEKTRKAIRSETNKKKTHRLWNR